MDDILDLGHHSCGVCHDDRSPPTWSIGLAFHKLLYLLLWIFLCFHAFHDNGPRMIWDSNTSNMEELNANGKEWTMGFYTTITFVPNIFEGACMQILKQIMDINYLTWIFSLALTKQTHLAHFFPPTHPPSTYMCCTSTCVATPLWGKCEVATHTPKNGTWESSRTPKNLEHDYMGQNNSHWSVLYIVGKVSNCRCSKWSCMSHLDIYSTSYGRKKGRKSN